VSPTAVATQQQCVFAGWHGGRAEEKAGKRPCAGSWGVCVCLMTVGGGKSEWEEKNNTSSTIIINLGTYLYTLLVYITILCGVY